MGLAEALCRNQGLGGLKRLVPKLPCSDSLRPYRLDESIYAQYDRTNMWTKRHRTEARWSLYESSWDMDSVLARCHEKGIPPEKVVKAMKKLHGMLNTPADRLAGALVIVLRLEG